MDAIKARFSWNVEEFLLAHRYHRRLQVRPALRWVVVILALFTGALALYSLVFVQFSWSATGLALVAAYVLWFRNLDRRWTLTRKYRRLGGFGKPREWTFTGERIEVKSEDGEGSFVWSSVAKWVETPAGFLLYPQEDLFFWLPFSAFDREEDLESLRQMARGRVSKIERVA